jgi:hypothetical protein
MVLIPPLLLLNGSLPAKNRRNNMGSKVPLDRKHLNVLWNHINKPSYHKGRAHTARNCEVDKMTFYQLFMNHILFMKDKFPGSDGRLCRYCEEQLTFYPHKERSKKEKKLKINYVKKPQTKRLTNLSIDRLNPKIGYTYDNIVFCCMGCNQRKSAATHADILNILRVMEEKLHG